MENLIDILALLNHTQLLPNLEWKFKFIKDCFELLDCSTSNGTVCFDGIAQANTSFKI